MSSSPYTLQGYGSGQFGAPPLEALPLAYYISLVTSEYRNSPKFNEFLTMLLKKFDDISQCLISMDTAFDIDFAVGPQLDAVGAVVGAARVVGFQPSMGISPVLDDDTYRTYIRAKAAMDTWDGTIDGLQAVWRNLFPFGHITIGDNQNMTATIFLGGVFTSIERDLITHGYIVPRPEGVLYNYVFPTLPAFGFDLDNAFVAGFDKGHFV